VAPTESRYSGTVGIPGASHGLDRDRHTASFSERTAMPWVGSLIEYQRYQCVGGRC
jgi:hypothetical protein